MVEGWLPTPTTWVRFLLGVPFKNKQTLTTQTKHKIFNVLIVQW